MSASGHMKGTDCLPLPLFKTHKLIALLRSPFKMPALFYRIRAPSLVLVVPSLEVQVVPSGSRECVELGGEPGVVTAQSSKVLPIKLTQVPLWDVYILHVWVQADVEQFPLPESPVLTLRANWEDSSTCCRCSPFPALFPFHQEQSCARA